MSSNGMIEKCRHTYGINYLLLQDRKRIPQLNAFPLPLLSPKSYLESKFTPSQAVLGTLITPKSFIWIYSFNLNNRQQPTRLLCPWDSPGKNTGVGCHFLLQCMKVKSESEVSQSCLTVSDPMDCSPPCSSVHGIFQAIVLEWVAISFSITLWDEYYYYSHFIDREPEAQGR